MIWLVVLSTLFGLTASTGVYAGKQDFTLINQTGVAIEKLYISPTQSDDWKENLLQDRLEDGESIDISFTGRNEKYWDIMVIDEDGNKYTWEKFNLSDLSIITLYMKGDKVMADYE
jgi:hypothetical protein